MKLSEIEPSTEMERELLSYGHQMKEKGLTPNQFIQAYKEDLEEDDADDTIQDMKAIFEKWGWPLDQIPE